MAVFPFWITHRDGSSRPSPLSRFSLTPPPSLDLHDALTARNSLRNTASTSARPRKPGSSVCPVAPSARRQTSVVREAIRPKPGANSRWDGSTSVVPGAISAALPGNSTTQNSQSLRNWQKLFESRRSPGLLACRRRSDGPDVGTCGEAGDRPTIGFHVRSLRESVKIKTPLGNLNRSLDHSFREGSRRAMLLVQRLRRSARAAVCSSGLRTRNCNRYAR